MHDGSCDHAADGRIGDVTHRGASCGGLKSAGTTGGAIGPRDNLILVGHGGGHSGVAAMAAVVFPMAAGEAVTAMAAAPMRVIGTTGAARAHKYYAHNYNHHRYYSYGRYYRNYRWYGGAYPTRYGYGNCAWLRRQALITNSPYWSKRPLLLLHQLTA